MDLAIAVNGVTQRPAAYCMPRLDRFQALHPTPPPGEPWSAEFDAKSELDPELRSYRSGFWGTIQIPAERRPGQVELSVEARLAGGGTASASLGTISVVERPEPDCHASPRAGTGKPLIAICMATYNPDLALFRTQVESIRAQTDRDWICLISDDCSEPESFDAITDILAGDPRFVVSRADERKSFYKNFERALQMAPPEAELIALSDHDDRWYPDKLEALREAIGSAGLVYSDLRRVDADGRVRAETLWQNRRNNRTNLASLLISNTIPGAACMFRRRVIERALPFPDGPGWDFHDHWLAVVALALGDIAFVDRPLYDYVQHPRAVLGRVASGREPSDAPRRSLADSLERWRSAYFSLYLQRELHAQVLLVRCAGELTARKRRALRLFVDAARSPLGFAWLAARPARTLFGRNETLGLEGLLAKGVLWRHVMALGTWRRERPGRWTHDARMPPVNPGTVGRRQRRWLAHL